MGILWEKKNSTTLVNSVCVYSVDEMIAHLQALKAEKSDTELADAFRVTAEKFPMADGSIAIDVTMTCLL